jgi:hypothetical protein
MTELLELTITDPWELAHYLPTPVFSAEITRRFPSIWVVKLDRPLRYKADPVLHLCLVPRSVGSDLFAPMAGPVRPVAMYPLAESLAQPEYRAMLKESALQAAIRAAPWFLIGGIREQPPVSIVRSDGLNYYAAHSDYNLIQSAEDEVAVRYVRGGVFRDHALPEYTSILAIPNLGLSETGVWTDNLYWIVERGRALRIITFNGEHRPAPSGGVLLRLAGLYSERSMIAGKLALTSSDPAVHEIFDAFAGKVRRYFAVVQDCWVGPEARQLFRSGLRFTPSVESDGAFDLAADHAL